MQVVEAPCYGGELADEPALADARLAAYDSHPRFTAENLAQDRGESIQLDVTPHEWRFVTLAPSAGHSHRESIPEATTRNQGCDISGARSKITIDRGP